MCNFTYGDDASVVFGLPADSCVCMMCLHVVCVCTFAYRDAARLPADSCVCIICIHSVCMKECQKRPIHRKPVGSA